jgi:hypothetical protein
MYAQIFQKWRANPRLAFLMDGSGALWSTAMLLVLAWLEPIFGMPQAVLYQLVPIAAVFALYSLGCYAGNPQNWRFFLYIIAIANLLYCLVTFILVVIHFEKLTAVGVAYFLMEKVVVASLAVLEIRVCRE